MDVVMRVQYLAYLDDRVRAPGQDCGYNCQGVADEVDE